MASTTQVALTVASVGERGAGVVTGGTTGQVLIKKSGTAYDTQWTDLGLVPNPLEKFWDVSKTQAQVRLGFMERVAAFTIPASFVTGLTEFVLDIDVMLDPEGAYAADNSGTNPGSSFHVTLADTPGWEEPNGEFAYYDTGRNSPAGVHFATAGTINGVYWFRGMMFLKISAGIIDPTKYQVAVRDASDTPNSIVQFSPTAMEMVGYANSDSWGEATTPISDCVIALWAQIGADSNFTAGGGGSNYRSWGRARLHY